MEPELLKSLLEVGIVTPTRVKVVIEGEEAFGTPTKHGRIFGGFAFLVETDDPTDLNSHRNEKDELWVTEFEIFNS